MAILSAAHAATLLEMELATRVDEEIAAGRRATGTIGRACKRVAERMPDPSWPAEV